MQARIFWGTLLALILAGGPPPAGAAKKLNVVASLPCLASITMSLGGDRVEVSSITRGVQDAHYVEAKPSYMVTLSKADLLIYSGLELEIGWLPLLIQGARNNKVAVGARGNLNASQALAPGDLLEKPRGEVDRSMGDVHPMGNPHYLLDPHMGLKAAKLIADRLAELDHEHQADYQRNLGTFQKDLSGRIAQWEAAAAGVKGLEVVCYHPHWSYLLNWLGLKNAGYIELKPGIPPTPKHKEQIIKLVRDRKIKLVIVSSWKDPTAAREVAKAGGASLLILPGEVGAMKGTEDYLSWINFCVTALAGAEK